MKLSDKLAALEEQEHAASSSRSPAPGSSRRQVARPPAPASTSRGRGSTASWHASKRKVRELVLAEVAPRPPGSPRRR